MITILLYCLLVIHALGLLLAPWAVGKERKPLTVGGVIAQSCVNLVVIVAIIVTLVRG